MKNTILFSALFALIFASLCVSSPSSAANDVKVTIIHVTPFAFCSLTHKGPYSEMDAVITELINHMQNQNITPQGPPISLYPDMPPDTQEAEMEWEVGFPVTPHSEPQAPLRKKIWDHPLVAQAVHMGAYETTGDTIWEMLDWMEEHGYVQDGPILGKYLNMPSPDTPPDKLRTEIWIPCKED
ncbi:MAG: GyrI-like domain-containing protein [Candidatus Aminicenantes bacterium]